MSQKQDVGTELVRELLRLHDNLEASRGIENEESRKVRLKQTERYWTLRGQIAKALTASHVEAA